ncbi:AAA family ATPase [Flagellimonas sp.]|uniref:AAA family ATPase n=1 Tax=Flagellimonas sp. TaxID=2058762 RepID=UPI003B5AFC1F
MLRFHYCKQYQKKVNGQVPQVENKFNELSNRNRLVNSGTVRDYGNGLYTLTINSISAKIIIQLKEIEGEDVYFVRDYIVSKDRGFLYNTYYYPELKSGRYLESNPIPDEEIQTYLDNRKAEEAIAMRKKNEPSPPPKEMLSWLSEYKLNIKYDIFETQDWVKYALSESDAVKMRDRDVKLFSELLSKVVYEEFISDEIVLENGLKIFIAKSETVGVLFSKLSVGNTPRYILHNGAHLKTQLEHWEESIQKLKQKNPSYENNIESLARYSFRAYPKWTLKNDELWFVIQKNNEVSNLSLTEDQLIFFKDFQFPYYINGQAGSGKSTMLYYLFANGFYYKCLDQIKGDLIFLTENEYLLEQTQKSVFDLLSNNPEFEGVTGNHLSDLNDHFSSFKEFLFNLVPKEDKGLFVEDKYLNFSKFKELYESSYLKDSIKRKYTAEECWFTIRTYIYGYDSSKNITSNDYLNIVYTKSQRIPLDKFKGIEESVLPFYERLINEESYWDRLSVIKHLEKNKSRIPRYDLVICDEAQDFCRVELRFILNLSSYLEYDLSKCDQIPIIFAGDPNQTVNPTGFREREMTEMLHTELKSLANFDYKKEDSVYNPKYNYRSKQPVVTLANFIQYYRKKNLEIRLVRPQIPKRPDDMPHPEPNLFFSESKLLDNIKLSEDLLEKIQYKIFIVPVDTTEKDNYCENSKLLSLVEDAEIKTSVEAKGAEYKQIVLYGFGEYYLKLFEDLGGEQGANNDEFKQSYFFNKLYVGITRAQKELIIIDSDRAKGQFWEQLVNSAEIDGDYWSILNEYKEQAIEYNPDSVSSVLKSNKEDAKFNAEQDKLQGTYDKNSSRLIVAANQFYKIGELNEYYFCRALAAEYKGNWKNAAEFYIKAEGSKNVEHAARCYFNGQHFNELENYAGSKLKSINQDVRLIISRFMTENKLEINEIKKLNNNRELLRIILDNITWRGLFIDKLVQFPIADNKTNEIREFAEILNNIANSTDEELWGIIGNLFYKVHSYKKATKAWERVGNIDSEKYILAKIEISKDEGNKINELVWLGRLGKFYEDGLRREKIENEIINIYLSNVDISEDSKMYHLIAYESILTQKPNREVHLLGERVEKSFQDEMELILESYKTLLLENRLATKVKDYVSKRYLKCGYIEFLNQGFELEVAYKKILIDYNDIVQNNTLNLKKYDLEGVKEISSVPSKILFDPPKHFKNLRVKSFRQFEELEFKNLGQYNLIVGDNNVGKTSLLELLLFSADTKIYFRDLAYAYKERLNLPRQQNSITTESSYNITSTYIDDFLCSKSGAKSVEYLIWDDSDKWEYSFGRLTDEKLKELLKVNFGIINDDFIGFYDNGMLEIVEIKNILETLKPSESTKSSLIPYGKGFSLDLAQVYFDNIDKFKNIRNEFIKNMKVFIPDIERIIVDTENGDIIIEESSSEYGHKLYEFGEGANKLFRILVQITLHKDNKLLIDEIDAGIHHSRFLEFWKIILVFAEINNTQIFATTHNLECIKHFDALLEKEGFQNLQDKSRVITLKQLPNNSIKAYVRLYNEFNYELGNDFELRGE